MGADVLKELAAAADRKGLEEAWLEELENPGPAAVFLEALDEAPRERRAEFSTALLPLVLETYQEQRRNADALAVARRLADFDPESRPLRRILLALLREVHKGEAWLEVFLRSAGIEGDARLPEALALFDRFEPFKPGGPVEHRAGWGIGVVAGYNQEEAEVRIRFHDGRERELPLSSALESLAPLDPGDLRAMYLMNPDGLRELARTDPGLLVRKAVALGRGQATASEVKSALIDRAVPAAEWSRWWTGAKKAAAHDPFLKIEGGGRPVFSLRDEPVSMSESAIAAVREARDLAGAVERVRAILPQDPSPELLEAMLSEITGRVEARLGEGGRSAGDLLEAVLVVEECGRSAPRGSGEILLAAGTAAAALALLQAIPSEKGRREGLYALARAFADGHGEALAARFLELPRDLMVLAIDLLVREGRAALLAEPWRKIESEPWNHPWGLYFLARKVFSGELAGEGLPRRDDAVLVMLRCLEATLFHTQQDRNVAREVIKRYEELLIGGRGGVLDAFIEKGERPMLERAFKMVHVTSRLPRSFADRLSLQIPARFPDLKKHEERAFWEMDAIFSLRAGIERRRLDLKEIVEVKLPENSQAIGRAASFGDLSENAEWTAAIEERRLLGQKVKDMQAELSSARMLEEETLPEGIVAPGMRVTFREAETGRERVLTILGPWDVGDEGIISYKAPLAAGLLGKKAGDEAELRLPSGRVTVTVLKIERAI